jgi:predicted RNase H-like nuclease (RuvC/YqgF family)
MEKINITLKEDQNCSILYGNMTIEIYPYMSLNNKLEIIGSYVDTLFKGNDIGDNYITAEYILMLSVIDKCTNININDSDIIGHPSFSGLWESIKSNIKNYSEFRNELDKIVELKQKDKSVSAELNRIVYKISGFINELSKMDLSENGIKQLLETYGELTSNIDDLNKTLGNNKRGKTKKNVQ